MIGEWQEAKGEGLRGEAEALYYRLLDRLVASERDRGHSYKPNVRTYLSILFSVDISPALSSCVSFTDGFLRVASLSKLAVRQSDSMSQPALMILPLSQSSTPPAHSTHISTPFLNVILCVCLV